MRDHYEVLIVGGGHAGAQTAIGLGQHGFNGDVAILNAEDALPYQRPPLSKAYLAGASTTDRLLIRPATYWRNQRVDLLTGRRVVEVAPDASCVTTDRGETIGYDRLVWAAGSTPRELDCPGHDLPGVHALRSLADADALRRDIASVTDVVLIGGGYIGLETASILTKLGLRVTVVESLNRVLARVSTEAVSRFYEDEHRAQGVQFRLGCNVIGFEGDGERLAAVHLSSGEVLPCQVAVVGVGGVAATDPVDACGAARSNGGLLVDAHGRTSVPNVFAVGDCAVAPNPYAAGRAVRLESVQNAVDQAISVARFLCGETEPAPTLPYFWSDQYDLRLRTTGFSGGHDETILRGDPKSRSFSVIYLCDGQVIAVDSVNAMKDFAHGRALVQHHARIDRADLADTSIPLAEHVASGT